MNEETRAVAVQFLFSENLFRIFGIGFYLPSLPQSIVPLALQLSTVQGVAKKEGECTCPHSCSLHHNFVPDGRYSERGWAYTPPTLTKQGWFFHHDGMYARKWHRHSVSLPSDSPFRHLPFPLEDHISEATVAYVTYKIPILWKPFFVLFGL